MPKCAWCRNIRTARFRYTGSTMWVLLGRVLAWGSRRDAEWLALLGCPPSAVLRAGHLRQEPTDRPGRASWDDLGLVLRCPGPTGPAWACFKSEG